MILSRTLERLVVPPRLRRRALLVSCLSAALGFSACRDALVDPIAEVVAEESAAALALGVSVADPAVLASEGGHALDGEGTLALEGWRASWIREPARGRSARESVYGPLSAALAGCLDRDAIGREIELLDASVRRARTVEPGELPLSLAAGVEAAASHRAAARSALDREDPPRAIEHLLRGGDALREIGPEAVARALVIEVSSALRRIPADAPYSERDLERIRRLVSGSGDAVDNGEWILAIRRAYYARALLEGHGG